MSFRDELIAVLTAAAKPSMVILDPKPCIADLERMISEDPPRTIDIAPNGDVRIAKAATVGDLVDAIANFLHDRPADAGEVGRAHEVLASYGRLAEGGLSSDESMVREMIEASRPAGDSPSPKGVIAAGRIAELETRNRAAWTILGTTLDDDFAFWSSSANEKRRIAVWGAYKALTGDR